MESPPADRLGTEMTTNSDERRLTARVHAVWKKLAGTGLPRRSQIDPADFGVDWANCLMIDVDQVPERSRFAYVGISLRDPTWPTFDRQCISECLDGSLLELVTRHVSRVAVTRNPISFGGPAMHDETSIVYRTVLLPLSETGERVDGVLCAIAFRELVVSTGERAEHPTANGTGRGPHPAHERRNPRQRH
jgi:hypothetical protein